VKNAPKIPPRLMCNQPGCTLALRYLNSTNTQDVYGCTRGHIRKIARFGQRIDINRPPDNAA